MTLLECVAVCAANPEYVASWRRLRGVSLPVTGLDRMIDDATGHGDAIAKLFIEDVNDLIYSRLPLEAVTK